MRVVGAATQAAIDSQVFNRAIRVSVFDESSTAIEYPITGDLLVGEPVVSTDLEQMTWRMDLSIVRNTSTSSLVLEGRLIQAWESFAAGEELDLFRGRMTTVTEARAWEGGVQKEVYSVTCMGELAVKLNAELYRFEWRPTGHNPDAANPYAPVSGERQKLTGIVRTYRVNVPFVATGTAHPVPILNLPYFPTPALSSWVTVRNSAGSVVASAGNWTIARNATGGAFEITWTTNPGATFTVDMMAVDRWVLLSRRYWHNGTSRTNRVPYYYILSGVAGQSGAETLNDVSATTVTAVTSSSVFTVSDASFIFASDSSTERFVAVTVGGVECVGKVSSVSGSTVTLTTGLRNPSTGAAVTPAVGNTVTNCSSMYFEVLDKGLAPEIYQQGGTYFGSAFIYEPNGGVFLYPFRNNAVYNVTPGYNQDQTTASAGAWNYELEYKQYALEAATTRSANDVSTLLGNVLSELYVGSYSLDPTGYTMGCFAMSPVKGLDLVDGIRKTIPPNYKVYELEGGSVVGRYITQSATPSHTLRGVRNFKPKPIPMRYTRACVRGTKIETNRAGQLLYKVDNLSDIAKMFNGAGSATTDAGYLTNPNASARAWFAVPSHGMGLIPRITKVTIASQPYVMPYLGAWLNNGNSETNPSGYKMLPPELKQGDGSQAFQKREFTDLTWLSTTIPNGASSAYYLVVWFQKIAGADQYVDNIEVFTNDGVVWETALTSSSSTAPADGPLGVNGFGSSWKITAGSPVSRKYAPLDWLKRHWAAFNDPLTNAYHFTLFVDAEGLTTAQARAVAESSIDLAIRNAERYECEATYDPRTQKGDTVEVPLADGSSVNLLVWSISKEGRTMKLELADYSAAS